MSRVTIVGGGLAGSLLAVYLCEAGHLVELIESRPDLRSVEIDSGRSINLALAHRGLAALEEVGLSSAVEPLLIPMRGRMVHDPEGSAELQPYGTQAHEVIYSVSRNDLNASLLEAAEQAGATLRFGLRCVGGDLGARTIVLADDGRQVREQFDVLVGADGVGSPVRGMLEEAGHSDVTIDLLDHGYKELVLPSGPDGEYLIDPNALHIWPRGGFMLIALPNLDGSFTCTLFAPHKGPNSFEALEDTSAIAAFFEEHFPDFTALMPDVSEEFAGNPTGTLGTVRVEGWHAGGRVVILGDAAHGIVPFHGQGMNAAFESCARLMAIGRAHEFAWHAVFEEFSRLRKPDTDAIADMALDNYIEMRSSVIDERYVLKRTLALELQQRFPQQFIPRYGMVMFTSIPYAEVQRRAAVQATVLDSLTEGKRTLDEVDFSAAAALVERLPLG